MRQSSKYKAKVLTVTTLAVMAAVLGTATASFGANGGNGEAKGDNRVVAIERARATLPFAPKLTAIDTGERYTCAIVSGAAKCWGINSTGQLGNNSTTESLVPVQVSGLESGVTAIDTSPRSDGHTCAIVSGAAKCWGYNENGQLGDNSTTQSLVPVQVSGLESGVTAIATGREHTCAIVSGAAKCWGRNNTGQLGDNSTTQSLVPVQVSGLTSGVTAIATGAYYTCAIVSGAAKCWGYNENGQLGDNSTTQSLVPVQVSGLTSGVTAIATGVGTILSHTCAIVSGAAKCWGAGFTGELGDGSTTQSLVPVQVSGLESGVTAIATGSGGPFGYTCAVVSGAAKCWGRNNSGQLGDNSTTPSLVPVQVSGLESGVTAIATGGGHTCAIVSGAAKCWGNNNSGQLGDNSTTPSLVPVSVLNLT